MKRCIRCLTKPVCVGTISRVHKSSLILSNKWLNTWLFNFHPSRQLCMQITVWSSWIWTESNHELHQWDSHDLCFTKVCDHLPYLTPSPRMGTTIDYKLQALISILENNRIWIVMCMVSYLEGIDVEYWAYYFFYFESLAHNTQYFSFTQYHIQSK